ncbi:unnamed protein product [Meganyctiphanes norvegica]|uniref:protein-tyrosine-phosphatase n=1 Tax=Meganyctiphanes norvegica TaxID=48144 RepID=A0AAV2S827_MEGNR
MGDCDSLYRSILRGAQCSPELASEMSPMSSLAVSLHHATNLSSTPVKRLSLSSDTSSDNTSSFVNDSLTLSGINDSIFSLSMVTNGSTKKSPLLSTMVSKTPLRMFSSENKENKKFIRNAFSLPKCVRENSPKTPLKEVQNKCNRTLQFISPKEMRIPLSSLSSKENICSGQSSRQNTKGKCSTLNFSSPQGHESPKPQNSSRKFSSLSLDKDNSISMDLLLEDDPPSENQPTGLLSLLSAPIKCSDNSPEYSLKRRRSLFYKKNRQRRMKAKLDLDSDLSMDKENTPPSSRDGYVRETESRLENESSYFKRPLPPSRVEHAIDCKRRKLDASPFQSASPTIPVVKRQISHEPLRPSPMNLNQHQKVKLFRSNSESQVSIIKALNQSATVDEKLTGDLSRPIALPTILDCKNPDLPSISADTMVELLNGKYEDKINSFKILDCRYPYEYAGGHIKGAVSWSSSQKVLDHLEAQKDSPVIPAENQKRDILIFHCEFSANRGPKSQRLMREKDRTASTNYPALHFPEMYLLEGGYKVFYQQFPEMCTPQGYTMMVDPKHAQDLKHFRAKSKSWANDVKKLKNKSQTSTGLRKLRL